MKGKYGGPMSVEAFFQALWQDRDFFDRHNITHIQQVYFYFTPCNEFGEPVMVSDMAGHTVDGYVSAGAYHSAAEEYDLTHTTDLEPKPCSRDVHPPLPSSKY